MENYNINMYLDGITEKQALSVIDILDDYQIKRIGFRGFFYASVRLYNVLCRYFGGGYERDFDIYDLWKLSSLKFEKLEGFENRFSARLNQQWRLELEMNWENQQKTIALILVAEVSKHYGG